jgi:hypothetical protein
MLTPRRFRVLAPRAARALLSTACLLAALGLGACDAAIETAHEAQRDADEAARLAASAGKPRATDKLLDRVKSGDVDALRNQVKAPDARGLRSELVAGLTEPTKDKDLTAALEELTIKDLEKANAAMTRALGFKPGPALESAFHTEAGNIAMQLSAARFQAVQGKLQDLARGASALQLLSETAIGLGAEAASLTANAKAPAQADVDKARGTLDERAKAAAAAGAEVARIEKEIADRQAQARTIYAATDAAFQAADAQKGQAAIDAANKATADRKRAEALTEEAANLEPALVQARRAQTLAQIQQKDAEAHLAAAQAAFDAAAATAKQMQDRAAALRQAAAKILNDPDGIAAQYKALAALADDIDKSLASAAKAADDARGAFGRASTSYSAAMNDLKKLIADLTLDNKDILVRISNDTRPRALLSWNQSAALDQAGRIQLAGFTAARIMEGVVRQAQLSYQAAAVPADAAVKAPATTATYRKAAADAFTAAVAAADAGVGMSGPDLEKIKWIGFSLKAISQLGLARTADGPPAATALADAQKTATDAVTRNPDLRTQMQRLTLVK